MKIKETIERECCEGKDLVPMPDQPTPKRIYFFCKYCGRHWRDNGPLEPNGGGGIEAIKSPWMENGVK